MVMCAKLTTVIESVYNQTEGFNVTCTHHKEKENQAETIMIGETPRSNPTVQIPPWDCHNEHPTANIYSPFSFTSPQANASNFNGLTFDNLTAFHRYLPSNTVPDDIVSGTNDLDIPVDTLSCEEFRMYEFKVKKCTRVRSHDWTECPYAHPGEKARRRDPRKYHYSGSACSDFRKGACRKGDSCEYAHGVFEFWLHPARYRTQPCKDGTNCRRRTCFFAHTTDQLRILPSSESYDESPGRIGCNAPRFRCFETGNWTMDSSPTSVLHSPSPPSPPLYDSPPLSPTYSVNYLTGSMRNIQIGSRRLMTTCSMNNPSDFSPRSPIPLSTRPGFMSLPSTPNRNPTRPGLVAFELWDKSFNSEEEPIMERVESGKDLRAKIYAKLSKENSLYSSAGSSPGPGPGPDLGWISELVK